VILDLEFKFKICESVAFLKDSNLYPKKYFQKNLTTLY